MRELQPYVGKVIEAKIIELDRNRNNVVLSRRAWLEEAQKEQRGDFLQNLKPGERRKGVVSSVVNFGAFVDLGGMDGLVHVSELSLEARRPPVVGGVGGRRDRGRGARRRPRQGAHQPVAEGHPVRPLAGVRRHATRWASSSTAASPSWCPSAPSCRWATASRAWCTSRRWPVHHVDLPEQVVTPGEELWVKIIDIDLQRRRICLSIKQAAEGGEVSEEYREAFGEHAYDEEGNYIGFDYAEGEFTPETEAQAAWADFAEETGTHVVRAQGRDGERGPRRPRARLRLPAEAAASRLEAAAAAAAEAAPVARLHRPKRRRAAPERRRRSEAHQPSGAGLRLSSSASCRASSRGEASPRRLGVVGEEQHRVEQLELEQRRPAVHASRPCRPGRRWSGRGAPRPRPGPGRPTRELRGASPWRR